VAGVTGHSDIAPGRKTDPGPYFSWGRLRRILIAAGKGEVALLIEPEGRASDSDRMRWPFPLAGRPL
jgi:AmpD protein